MGLTLDKELGERVLREEAQRAQHDPGPEEWVARVERLSEIDGADLRGALAVGDNVVP